MSKNLILYFSVVVVGGGGDWVVSQQLLCCSQKGWRKVVMVEWEQCCESSVGSMAFEC